jgi:hypothetical protein
MWKKIAIISTHTEHALDKTLSSLLCFCLSVPIFAINFSKAMILILLHRPD